MPFVNVKIIEDIFTPVQKQEIIRKVTDAMLSVAGENLRPVTVVVLEEVKSGDWGVGGQTISSGHVKEIIAGKPRQASTAPR